MRSLDSNQPKLPIFFINNLKTAFCPCHSFFSLSSALNYSFSPVQNLYRFEFIIFKKVLWLNVLGYVKRLPHACHMKTIERELKELIAADSNICRNYKLLTSIKGVGPITAIVMLCSTLNFTKITDHRKFACYCGLAPFEHSSGTSVRGGCHTSSMANRDIKVQLNRSALIAIRCDPQLKAYYERKVAEGKHKFSVLNAVRAKIAARCFAVVRRGTPYVALQI